MGSEKGGGERTDFPLCAAKRARIWLLEGSEGICAVLPGRRDGGLKQARRHSAEYTDTASDSSDHWTLGGLEIGDAGWLH
jgi:hypothetical protein